MHYKPENFNCRPNTLKKIAAGHYEVVGNSGVRYVIEDDALTNWGYRGSNGCGGSWHLSMLSVLEMIKQLEPALNNKQTVTLTDGTNDEIKRLRAENVELNKTIVRLEDLAVEMDNKNQSLEAEIAGKDTTIRVKAQQIKEQEDAFSKLSNLADGRVEKLQGVIDEQKSNIDDHERWLKRDHDVIVNLRKDLDQARVDRDKHKDVALERLHAIDILEGLIIRMVRR